MRPTLLHFRSSKEKTPLSYDYKSTYDGRSLCFKAPKGDPKKRTFSCEKRFVAYDILAKRTGYRVGPGSYSPELYRPRIRSGSPYREFHNNKNIANNGYYMVGNCLEFDPGMMLASDRKMQKEKEIKVDCTYTSSRFAKTSTSSFLSASVERQENENSQESKRKSMITKSAVKKKSPENRKEKIKGLLRKRFK